MATVDRISKWNVNYILSCVPCQQENKSVQHLFSMCRYSAEVWASIHTKFNLTYQRRNFGEECRIAASKAHGKNKMTRVYVMLFYEAVHAM